MIQKITLGIAVLALIVAGITFLGRNSVEPLGGNTSYQKQSFLEGFYGGTGRQFQVSRTGALTTSAGLQVYATSTATIGCFAPSLTGATSTFDGTMYFSYGSC